MPQDKCCKCNKVIKTHSDYRKVYHNEKIHVIDKGIHIYCLECFEKYVERMVNTRLFKE